MNLEESSAEALDFEKDLVTTQADIKNLRANRPVGLVGDLSDVNALRSPFPPTDKEFLRRVFNVLPPFEL